MFMLKKYQSQDLQIDHNASSYNIDLQKFKTYINKTFEYLMITVMHIYFGTIVEKIIARTFNV